MPDLMSAGGLSAVDLTAERQIAFGTRIKALGNGRLGGYLVHFTGPDRRDLAGEYFDRATDFGDTPDTYTRVMYHHAMDKTVGAARLGTVETVKFDDEGIWIEAQLDLNHEYAQRVQKLVERGALSWSSGAIPQSARVDTNGHIRTWPIYEASLTPTPAEPFGTRIQSIKSIADAESLESLLAKEGFADANERTDVNAQAFKSGTTARKEVAMSATAIKNVSAIVEAVIAEVGELTAEQVVRITAAIEAGMAGDVEAVNAAEPDELAMEEVYDEEKATAVQKAAARIASAAASHARHELSKQAAKVFSGYARHGASAANPYANSTKARAQAGTRGGENQAQKNAPWAHNGAPAVIEDLAHKARWAGKSAQFLSALAGCLQLVNDASPASKRITMPGLGALYQTAAAHALEEASAGRLNIDFREAAALSRTKAMKANELDNTAQTDYGAEFVHTVWGQQLVEHARRANVVAPLIPSFEMPAKLVKEPVRGSVRGSVYFVPESTADTHQNADGSAIPDSKVQTDERLFTAGKLATRIGWSREIDEDSIVPFTQYVIDTARENLARSIDHVLLMGDNATSGNINYDGDTPSETAEYMIFDGIALAGLANGRDGGGNAITYADFLATRYLLNREANGDLTNIVFFIPPELEHYMLQIDEIVTVDKFGPQAPVLTGQIGRLGGIPVVVTPVIQLAASDGKITYNAAGTLGRGVMAYLPGWKVGYRRAPEPYLWRAPDGESWQMTLTTRMDLQNSQQTKIASMIYNVLG